MRDALLAVAGSEHTSIAHAQASGDPAARLSTYVDDLNARASATKTARDRIAAVFALLDDDQKAAFLARLGDAFAKSNAPPSALRSKRVDHLVMPLSDAEAFARWMPPPVPSQCYP